MVHYDFYWLLTNYTEQSHISCKQFIEKQGVLAGAFANYLPTFINMPVLVRFLFLITYHTKTRQQNFPERRISLILQMPEPFYTPSASKKARNTLSTVNYTGKQLRGHKGTAKTNQKTQYVPLIVSPKLKAYAP